MYNTHNSAFHVNSFSYKTDYSLKLHAFKATIWLCFLYDWDKCETAVFVLICAFMTSD